MKLKFTFETVDVDGEIIAVPIGKDAGQVGGVLKINKEAEEILNLLTEDTTESAIIEHLAAKYENTAESISSYVRTFIQSLREAGLIFE